MILNNNGTSEFPNVLSFDISNYMTPKILAINHYELE